MKEIYKMKEIEYKLHYDNFDTINRIEGVYLLRNLDNNKLKIGSSINLNDRIKVIESNFRFCGIEPHLKIECFIEFKHNLELEKFLHKYLKQYNYMNEWFSIDNIDIVLKEIKFFKDNDKIDFYTRDKYKNIYKQMKEQAKHENAIICNEWQEYRNFEVWIHDNYYETCGECLKVSKEIINKDNNIYCPEMCILLSKEIYKVVNAKCVIKENTKGLFRFEHKVSHWNQCDNNIVKSDFIYNSKLEAIEAFQKSKYRYLDDINSIYEDTIPKEVFEAINKLTKCG
jgi:hypothetical protein